MPNYDPSSNEDEGPVREVRLEAFQIGRYPVTVLEYTRFVQDGGYREETWWKNGGFGRRQPEGWDEQLLHPNRDAGGFVPVRGDTGGDLRHGRECVRVDCGLV